MQNINLYRLMSELYARPEVEDADIVSCMCEDDTLKTVMCDGPVVAIGVQDECPTVALYTIYASDEDYRNKEPLIEGLYYDFEDDHDYKDGVEDIIKEACCPMDTVIFVKDRCWPGTDSSIYEISSADLGAICVADWSWLTDGQLSGNVLPDERLRERYFALSEREDASQADWNTFIDDLWQTADGMGLEELADWFAEMNDPTTITARYWVHGGVEYLDAAHTMPRSEM